MIKKKSRPWYIRLFVALGGVAGIIATILAVIPILQTERDVTDQANANATQLAIQNEQLRTLQDIATLQAQVNTGSSELAPTVTAIAEKLIELESTRQAIKTPSEPYPTPIQTISVQKRYRVLLDTYHGTDLLGGYHIGLLRSNGFEFDEATSVFEDENYCPATIF